MGDVFIIGSKGIPPKYGGFETFVHNLTKRKKDPHIKYHIACLATERETREFSFNNARCFRVRVPNIGSGKAVLYDLLSLIKCLHYIKKNKIEKPIIYILASRIGPILYILHDLIKKMGITIFLNPDGHEWKRSKWNRFIKWYWKLSERLMLQKVDLVICDSLAIEAYINDEYQKFKPKTIYISYGADIQLNIEDDFNSNSSKDEIENFLVKHQLKKFNYYLMVGRFVPENNYELILREFISSKTKKDLVIITNIEENKFYHELLRKTAFTQDKRVKFVGAVYNERLLRKIRNNAYAYIHGHEVGGTNPSLLEALSTTRLNLLLGVNFNTEVGGEGGLYFSKETSSLAETIEMVEMLEKQEIEAYSSSAKDRIEKNYSWDKIVMKYEELFLNFDNHNKEDKAWS